MRKLRLILIMVLTLVLGLGIPPAPDKAKPRKTRARGGGGRFVSGGPEPSGVCPTCGSNRVQPLDQPVMTAQCEDCGGAFPAQIK